MQLNSDGERLLSQIAPALDSLSDAVEAMTSGIEVLRLRLGILPLYAAQRLFPRLADLRAKLPELHLDIYTAGTTVARLGEGLAVAIAPAREIDPALHAEPPHPTRVYALAAWQPIARPTHNTPTEN